MDRPSRCGRIARILLIYIKLVSVIGCTIVLNIFQILTIPLIPFAHYWIMDVTSFLAGTAWRLMNEAFEQLANGRIVLSGDEDIPEGESALIISNHVSFADVFLLHALALRKKMLPHCRYFAKYIPFFGWGMYLSGMPMLARNWERDQRRISKVFELYRTLRYPVWLISFVEGSRFSSEKSQEYAKARGLEHLDLVQVPRCKGFAASLQGLEDTHVGFVYDITLVYWHRLHGWGHAPSLFDILAANLGEWQLYVHVERFAMDEIPVESYDATASWLRSRYTQKDALLKRMRHALENGQDVLKAIGKLSKH